MKKRYQIKSEPGLWDWVKESPQAVTVFFAALVCLIFWPHYVFESIRIASAAIYAVLESISH